MAQLTDEQMLAKVKTALGITGDFQDDVLMEYVTEAKSFMVSAGVSASVASSSEAAGEVTRLVSDLWNYGTGTAKLSEYAVQRLIQLALKGGGEDA